MNMKKKEEEEEEEESFHEHLPPLERELSEDRLWPPNFESEKNGGDKTMDEVTRMAPAKHFTPNAKWPQVDAGEEHTINFTRDLLSNPCELQHDNDNNNNNNSSSNDNDLDHDNVIVDWDKVSKNG
ncbi:hypothetical protein RFI_04980 [Reticulomyxa filosa]|uniref:Uncharacterized protein n=1 Tax=Reticulomyxa filosa TaxID=46433 RepID=X6P3J0_RETFI|nr:hypothetical protein RFI_04980 [Reticulomyxa filosa]|eukprot:ETO32137.1 hypothetical protein RFI_04980 [Reticulomyxa filosa]